MADAPWEQPYREPRSESRSRPRSPRMLEGAYILRQVQLTRTEREQPEHYFQQQLALANREINQQKKNCEDLENEGRIAKEERLCLQGVVEELKNTSQELKTQNEELKIGIQGMGKAKKKLKKVVRKLKRANGELNGKVNELQNKVVNLETKNEEILQEITNLKTTHQQQATNLETTHQQQFASLEIRLKHFYDSSFRFQEPPPPLVEVNDPELEAGDGMHA